MNVAALGEATRSWVSAWEDLRVEAEDYRELDSERVLVLTRNTGRGKASGIDLGHMRAQGAQIVYVRDGKVTKFVRYLDRQRAFTDLGLASEAGTSGS